MSAEDTVERRIVVEFGRRYTYVYWATTTGKIVDEESFRQPYTLDKREAIEEAKDVFDLVYQHLLDTVGPSASGGENEAESG
jgi:hypothetical protein